jgi:lauroyl/myristoyl acyltransferase
MAKNLQRVINSPSGIRLVSLLGRCLPPRLGYAIANIIAVQISKRTGSDLVRSVQANQWVVRGETLSSQELDMAVRDVLVNTARVTFDLYHYIHDTQAAKRLIVMDDATQHLFHRPEFDRRGLVVAGLHMSAFDLVLQTLCATGMRPLVLTIPDPQGGRMLEYEMRRRIGMNILPASVGSLRHALRHLKQGGFVVTGIDRPISDPGAYPLFFGRHAGLPMHYVFLASKAHVPVMVMVARWQPDGKYHINTSELIEMDAHPDREIGAIRNAEKVLYQAERFIRQVPEQWLMTLPVWPEVFQNLKRGT